MERTDLPSLNEVEPTPSDPNTYLQFKSIKGSPLSNHKKFREMNISELVEYAKQSESNKKEARDMIEKEYYWWIEKSKAHVRFSKSYVMIAGFYGSFTTELFKQIVSQMRKEGKDPFDPETFKEWLDKNSIAGVSKFIQILNMIAVAWYIWYTLNNL